MKRVVVVLDNMKMGGSERQALTLARALKDSAEVRLKVIALQPPEGHASEICDKEGIDWSILRFSQPRNPVKLAAKLCDIANALRRERPDVLLPFTRRANIVCGLTWRFTGANRMLWNQRTACDEGILGRNLDRIAAKMTPVFVANSVHGATYLSEKFGRPVSQIHVINNGVQVQPPLQDRATWRKALSVNGNAFVACMVANIHSLKDHETLIRAWKIVADELKVHGVDRRLILAGRPGSTYASLQHLVSELGLAESVSFPGEVKDIAGLLSGSDLGVHSSLNEGTPNAILECMTAGLSVVATDTPGARSALGEGNADYLAPKQDVMALARQIIKFARDPELRARVGRQNKERVTREFSVEKMCDEFSRLIGLQD